MGMGPGESGSSFLGIPVVSSNSDHWVFSEGLLRAIALSLNGVNQVVDSELCKKVALKYFTASKWSYPLNM